MGMITKNRARRSGAGSKTPALPPADLLLWEHLSNRRLGRLRFTRERVLGKHIVDLYCSAEKLVIEFQLDGESCTKADLRRHKELENKGMRIVRIKVADVYNDTEAVIETIAGQCNLLHTSSER